MTERRKDRRFGRYIRLVFWTGIVLQFVLVWPVVLIVFGSANADWFLFPWVALAAVVWAEVKLARYRCNECGRKIGRVGGSNVGFGQPIVFPCESCDIEWDTTLKRMFPSGR